VSERIGRSEGEEDGLELMDWALVAGLAVIAAVAAWQALGLGALLP
jgi:hypothetical protein